jgi:signal transduction histidine kinase
VNLRLLLEELVASYRVRSQYDHIAFEFEASDTPVVSADGLLLKQALTNIVDNAVNAYEGSSGRIEIACRGAAGELSVIVQDHGCGIAPEHLDNIFTPFYSSRPSGTGLGLPLAARIVDLHHGKLLVDSQIGGGTTFTVVLPISVGAEPVSQTV